MPLSLRYSAIIDRPPLAWPGGSRLALWVVPNIEHYPLAPPVPRGRPQSTIIPSSDVGAYGLRDYGNRVGFQRMMPILKEYGFKTTLSLNIAVYELFPEILDWCEAEKFEIMCHGQFNTDDVGEMDRAEQSAYIAACQAKFESLTRRRFVGWFSPANTANAETASAAADEGLSYIVDYFHDDQPTLIANGRIVCLPYTMDLNDGWNFRFAVEANDFVRATIDQFEQLYADGSDHGRVMSLPLHPFVFGQPHRIIALRRLLDHIAAKPGVWFATGSEIANWWRTSIQDHVA
jgi:peptidoglycan/xylan/chitin deacetylase (PgdA/CDA1 family)